jgi:hypothetical protein
MKQPTKRILFTALTLIFLLAACAPAQVSTPDAAEVANQVATSVALTVASQNLETEQANPPVTETPLPTQTEVASPTAILPTATQLVLASPTAGSGGGSTTGGGTTTKPEFACDTIHRRPFDNTIFKPNDTFDIKWTIVNTGTKTMRAGLDLKYNSGTKLTSPTTIELPELKPGAQYAVNFDAVVPAREGTYVMTYIVEGGLCYPYVVIKVEK